jgi:hypothetical protein
MLEPKFSLAQSLFVMECAVEINIQAKPGFVWRILTDAKNFPRWNSTVTNIEGQIREGERLRVRVPGTDRIFSPPGFRCRAMRAYDMDRRFPACI